MRKAELEALVAEHETLVAELRMGCRLRDDIIRDLEARLDKANGASLEFKLAGLQHMIEAAEQEYAKKRAGLEELIDLVEGLDCACLIQALVRERRRGLARA